MTTNYIIAFVLLGLIVAGSLVFALTVSKNEALLKRRLNQLDEESEFDAYMRKSSKIIGDMSLTERLVYPYTMRIANFLIKMTPQQKLDKLNKRLVIAGNPNGMTATEFLGIQGLFGLVMPVIFGFLLIIVGTAVSKAFLVALMIAMAGFIMPTFWLSKLVTTRQKKILKSLPFTLDLLNISVDAGLGFDSAMDKVAQSMDGPIADEFSHVLSEIRLGKTRKEALKNMVERTDVNDLNQFIVAVIQAEKLGVGLGKLLKAQAKSMRQLAKQRAQEQAFKAPIKMLFPMILFIFPSIFVVLLGPAALYLPQVFGGL